MRSIIWTLAISVVFPGILYASDNTSTQLGALLAAEDACSMTYDKDAISGYIEKNVAADDLNFATELPLMTNGARVEFNEMTDTAKVAFCTQQRRAAKKLGFVK
ncbi:signal recognition particle [Rhizobium calliandrae]|uniref:Signal recognition particle n=1 Tax=Rhizobium calliandrae TaxID=1312182 RepID=A0ABT7KMX1_9HYPH|nr:signal recognition particle [Rhizobium calliandrae]MDL2409959.1 signal recognition particle [Rhizobium calliandrae]